MKHLLSLLLLLTLSCNNIQKSETVNAPSVDRSVIKMWNAYTTTNQDAANSELPESWFFHNNKEDADRLAKLVLTGKKQAGSGLYVWYEEANAPLPQIGTKHIITDFDGNAQAIIEIKRVNTIPFNQISQEYAALDMGTAIDPLEKWKKAHWDFFKSALAESNQEPTEDMLVVCEYFETIWPLQNS